MFGGLMSKYQKERLSTIIRDLEQIEAGGLHGQLPVLWNKARDYHVWDEFGKYYIDFTSTIFVTNCGHGAIAKAIRKQAEKLIHSYTFPTVIKWKFLKAFKQFLPEYCEKIFLASAGSEVTSWAVNLMREYKNKRLIVHIDGAFHGKTGVVEQLSHEEIRLPFNLEDPYKLEEIIKELDARKEEIAGFLFESYQGWSARFMNEAYVQRLCEWAKQNDIPVCFDEIQGGFWRTGKKFAYEWYDVEPDLICMGKGLGGGTPLSALAGRAKYFNVAGLSSTHSGNPLCCAAGLEAITIYDGLDKKELEYKSSILAEHLGFFKRNFAPLVVDVESHGLLASIIFKDTKSATAIAEECMKNGLLVVKTGRESIKIGPPLTISSHALIQGLGVIGSVMSKYGHEEGIIHHV